MMICILELFLIKNGQSGTPVPTRYYVYFCFFVAINKLDIFDLTTQIYGYVNINKNHQTL